MIEQQKTPHTACGAKSANVSGASTFTVIGSRDASTFEIPPIYVHSGSEQIILDRRKSSLYSPTIHQRVKLLNSARVDAKKFVYLFPLIFSYFPCSDRYACGYQEDVRKVSYETTKLRTVLTQHPQRLFNEKFREDGEKHFILAVRFFPR